MSRWSGVPTSSGAHRGRDADRRRLVPAARVERAGDLPLAVEDVPALLDPARDQHVAVDAEQVLAVEARLLHLLERAARLGYARDRHADRRLVKPPGDSCRVQPLERSTRSTPPWARRGLAARGAPEGARRLGRRSASAAAPRGATSRSSRPSCRPRARSAAASCVAPLPGVRRRAFSSAFAVDCEECGARAAAAPSSSASPIRKRALEPARAATRLDLGEADHRDGVVLVDRRGCRAGRGSAPSPPARRISGLSCSISRGESSPSVFTSTLSITASKTCSRGP